MDDAQFVSEVRVREHCTYSVSRYVDPALTPANSRTKVGSFEVAKGLTLRQANQLAQDTGRGCPNAIVTILNQTRRSYEVSGGDSDERAIFERLREHPADSTISYRIFPGIDAELMLSEVLVTPEECPRQPDYGSMSDSVLLSMLGDDASKWAGAFCQLFPSADYGLMVGWFANAIEHSSDVRRCRQEEASTASAATTKLQFDELKLREFEAAKRALGELPYPVAAAMRRNADLANDTHMLELLDRAQVAVDTNLKLTNSGHQAWTFRVDQTGTLPTSGAGDQ